MFYTNTQEYFLEMESHYCKADGQLIWPDGHPKNIFTDKNGNVAFIDFGRVHMGDKHFVLPNFLAHIALYGIAGYLEKGLMLSYLSTAIESYNAVETLNEELFCKYFGMEVLHRSSGKWIAGIDDRNLKLKNIGLGLTIFDEKIVTIDNLLGMIDETA